MSMLAEEMSAPRKRKFGGMTAWFVTKDKRSTPTYADVDGTWWLCVSHWGPVHDTGFLVVE